MKENFKLGIILLLYCAFFAGILAYVNTITKPVIDQLKAKNADEIRLKLMPGVATFEKKQSAEDTTFVYFIAKNDKGEVLGYNFIAAKKGYSSVVRTMVALDKNFVITNLQVIDQNETPGLGTHAIDKDFPNRFLGKALDDLKVDKDGGTIKSITGATITTRTITNSVHDGVRLVKEDLADAEPTPVQGTKAPTLLDRKAKKEAKQRQSIMPLAASFEERKAVADTSFAYYIAKDAGGNNLGYTFKAAKKGYCSVITSLVAVDKNLKILNLKVLKNDETPGLGSQCLEDPYIKNFKGKMISSLKVDKDGGPIVAVTGATITSRALTNSLRDGLKTLQKDLQSSQAYAQGGKK